MASSQRDAATIAERKGRSAGNRAQGSRKHRVIFREWFDADARGAEQLSDGENRNPRVNELANHFGHVGATKQRSGKVIRNLAGSRLIVDQGKDR